MRLSPREYKALQRDGFLPKLKKRSNWSNAQETTSNGITFPSKTEARVYERLCELYGAHRIVCQVRMPLLATRIDKSRCCYITIDFVVMWDGEPIVWVDAKTNRRSREWRRGAASFRTTWGTIVCWDGKGQVPSEIVMP